MSNKLDRYKTLDSCQGNMPLEGMPKMYVIDETGDLNNIRRTVITADGKEYLPDFRFPN
jgi:hypothetical protein